MDFIDYLNEDWELRFEEIGEAGDSEFILQDIYNDVWYRFYPEDIKQILEFLDWIKEHPNLDLSKSLNESFNLRYYGMRDGEESVLVLEDIDNDEEHNFYPEDIEKINIFLNRLKEFGVMK